MCKFEIYKNNVENSSVTLETKGNYRDINEAIYECLTERFEVNEETAIDIACWCELALVNDIYETDDITVIVAE